MSHPSLAALFRLILLGVVTDANEAGAVVACDDAVASPPGRREHADVLHPLAALRHVCQMEAAHAAETLCVPKPQLPGRLRAYGPTLAEPDRKGRPCCMHP